MIFANGAELPNPALTTRGSQLVELVAALVASTGAKTAAVVPVASPAHHGRTWTP